ncbi:MAG: hypothetical protein JWM95_569 [Gemmatimonadetes bacterium]|nr:hypothetical protein [Gemmatimonadota bacterium]
MNRRWTLALCAVGTIALAFGVVIADRYPVGVFHDDAMYVILARSLATGQGFRYLNIPGAPLASHFPPGYPFVLSLVWRLLPVFPANVLAFKLLNAVFFSASAVLITQLARERFDDSRAAVIVGLLSAISVPFLVLVSMVLSEPMFLALLLGLLIVAERLVASPMSRSRALACGACIGLLTLVRAHGIVMLPAVMIPLALHRRWKDAALVAFAAVAAMLPWQLWGAAHSAALPPPLAGNYGSYVAWWIRGYRDMGPVMILETVRRTTSEVVAMLATLFSPGQATAVRVMTLASLTGVFVAGAVHLRRHAPVTLGFLAWYAAIVLAWPFPPSRFVWGVWPLLLFLIVAAARARVPARLALAGALVWLTVGYAEYEVRAIRGKWWSSISRTSSQRIQPAVAWVLANTAPDDVVAADDEGSVFLYTGRQAVPVASFTTSHYLRDRSAAVEAEEGLVPLLAAFPVRAVLVGSQKTFNAAEFLVTRPTPLLARREQFAGGAAFTVPDR